MPPKRKNKATKSQAAKGTAKAAVGGAIRTSSGKARKTNLAAGRGTSRTHPSEPLHMNLRGASKAASNTGSPAVNSVADSTSRRSSLNSLVQDAQGTQEAREGQEPVVHDATPDAAHPNNADPAAPDAAAAAAAAAAPDDERPAKRRRLSGADSSQSQSQSLSPSKQQKQDPQTQSPVSNEHPGVAAAENADAPATGTAAAQPSSSARKRRSSSTSLPSDQPNGVRKGRGDGSSDPEQQNPNSTATQQPRRKKRKVNATPPDAANAAEQPPELTDASTPPESPENVPEVETAAELPISATNGDAPAKPTKRPGRRRQPHANMDVEVDLRRELNLKMAYRAMVKSFKPLLAELGARTIAQLENDPEYHKNCPEYGQVMSQLKDRFQDRITQLNAEKRLGLDQEDLKKNATEFIERRDFITKFYELQENMIDKIGHRMLQIERAMQVEDGDATDDEDNIIPPTRKSYIPVSADYLEDADSAKYGSRARPYIEVERAWEQRESRQTLGSLIQRFVDNNPDEGYDNSIDSSGFAAYAGPDRGRALHHHNLVTLEEAAHELETALLLPEEQKVLPNEAATALYLLASVSTEMPQESPIKTEKSPLAEADPVVDDQDSVPQRPQSPVRSETASSAMSRAMSLETVKPRSPSGPSEPAEEMPSVLHPEWNGIQTKEVAAPKEAAPPKTSSSNIMDLLNHTQDDPPPRRNDPRASGVKEKTPSASPAMRESVLQAEAKIVQNSPLRLDAIVHKEDQPVERKPTTPSLEPARPALHSPGSADAFWTGKNLKEKTPDANLPEKNPLARIKAMIAAHPEKTGQDKSHERFESSSRRESFDRSNMAPPRPLTSQERNSSVAESRRPSLGHSTVPSPSAAPAYLHSPHTQYAAPRHPSLEQTSQPHWDPNRRASGPGPHALPPTPPTGYGHPAPVYPPPDYNRGPPPPNSQQLPPFGGLPVKPSQTTGAQLNFRFAHYDPGLPPHHTARPPTNYAPGPPPPGAAGPPGPPPPPHVTPTHQSPYPGPTGPPLQFAPPYSGPQPYNPPPPAPYPTAPPFPGYQPVPVPPQGGYQPGPPPPPSYPPLKIHQYGGQPILPANMAPSQGPPPPPVPAPYGQPPPQFVQAPPTAAPAPKFEPVQPGPPPEPQPQPPNSGPSHGRRRYRGYNAAGTEFRAYNGPGPGRRRGGGAGN